MVRIFISFSLLLLWCFVHGQQLSHVQFSNGTTLISFGFTTDQQVIIKVSPEGKVLEWGMEWEPTRYNYQPGKLLPYMGRVEYYRNEADSTLNGKVKMIGTTLLNYYPSSEAIAKAGKVRSIGSLQVDYYAAFDNAALNGKLKSAGNNNFNYYYSYENDAFKGKLKNLNNTTLTYYSTFDDKLIKGKLRSIDANTYAWFTSYETKYGGGGLKSGQWSRNINGVIYIIM